MVSSVGFRVCGFRFEVPVSSSKNAAMFTGISLRGLQDRQQEGGLEVWGYAILQPAKTLPMRGGSGKGCAELLWAPEKGTH